MYFMWITKEILSNEGCETELKEQDGKKSSYQGEVPGSIPGPLYFLQYILDLYIK